jgi:hypothetical protein
MPAKQPPETWFWSHDIKPTQIDSVVTPGSRLVRLSSYGEGAARRFAALVYQEPGLARSYALDLDAAALTAKLADTGARPVAITVAADARFSVVLETGPGPLASVHVDLDEAGLRGLIDDQHAIADLATYVAGGARRYAAIVEERATRSWLLAGVSAPELDAKLLEHEAGLTRLRAYRDGATPRFTAIAERGRPAGWAWYADLDGDGVAKQLEVNASYPIDLDATRGDRGARFTVVMVRER